jgi:hypothetical protein
MIVKEQSQMEANEDFSGKVRDETEKNNQLLDELIQI